MWYSLKCIYSLNSPGQASSSASFFIYKMGMASCLLSCRCSAMKTNPSAGVKQLLTSEIALEWRLLLFSLGRLTNLHKGRNQSLACVGWRF